MTSEDFLHDCTRCAALCCMAPQIVKSARFPIDKPAATACPNLDGCGLCRIHDDREAHGFKGCIDFTCLGAGQVVTQDLFGGRSWQDDPALLDPMARAFLDLYRVQEARWLLMTAAFMGLPADREAERKEMARIYEPGPDGWSKPVLDRMLAAQPPNRVRDWLRSLAGAIDPPQQAG